MCVNFEHYQTNLRDSYVIYNLNSSRPILEVNLRVGMLQGEFAFLSNVK